MNTGFFYSIPPRTDDYYDWSQTFDSNHLPPKSHGLDMWILVDGNFGFVLLSVIDAMTFLWLKFFSKSLRLANSHSFLEA